jgi:hypothetical protein
MTEKIKKSTIHRIMKSLSPKREVNSKKKGFRTISRSITPKAIEYITEHINDYLNTIIQHCELSLSEINNNPNSYYRQHRYDIRVVKKAIEKIKNNNN